MEIGPTCLIRMNACQECRGRARVVARPVAKRPPGDLGEAAEDVHLEVEIDLQRT